MMISKLPNTTFCLGVIQIHFPQTEEPTSQGEVIMASIASSVPPRFTCNACRNSPLTIHAQAVVMPQVGHGFPNICIKVHVEKPSCLCVPTPEGSGSKFHAVIKSVIKTKLKNSVQVLRNQEKRSPMLSVTWDTVLYSRCNTLNEIPAVDLSRCSC